MVRFEIQHGTEKNKHVEYEVKVNDSFSGVAYYDINCYVCSLAEEAQFTADELREIANIMEVLDRVV